MDNTIILSLITVAASIISALAGWLFGRRKYNADSYIMEIKGMKDTLSFNKAVTDELRNTLEQYITLAQTNSNELFRLKKVVDILIDNSCLVKGCALRLAYSDNKLQTILGLKEDGEEKHDYNDN